MPKHHHSPLSRYIPVCLTLGLGVGLSIIGFFVVWNWEGRRQNYEFNRKTSDISLALERQLNTDVDAVLALGDFFAASNQVERVSFQRFLQRSLILHSSLQILAWSPRVLDQERLNYEQAAERQTGSPFTITQRDAQGKLMRAAKRTEYFPIYYVEPLVGNEASFGFDLASNPDYRAALEHARDTGNTVISSQIERVSGNSTEPGMLVIQPIYKNGVTPSIVSSRRRELEGFVLGMLQIKDLFQTSLKGLNTQYLNLYLVDETPQNYNSSVSVSASQEASKNPIQTEFKTHFKVFYDSNSQQVILPNPQMQTQLMAREQCPVDRGIAGTEASACVGLLKLGNQQWSLYIIVTPEFHKNQKRWRSWGALIIGLLWTFIPVTYMLTAQSRTTQIEKLAQERSRQAQQLQAALKQLETEQAKSEQLLLNVLPAPIAARLKQDEHNIADSFAEVTVLFADIVGFTELATRIPAPGLVKVLNDIFSAFDHLAERHGLEKIKTIGDAYMVVGGLPNPRPDHAEAMADMALDMQREIRRLSLEHDEMFSIRVGMNTGPVIAGVIGIKRFIYDLWGDTVNIASRMESQGITGCIQVTEAVYEQLQDRYEFEKRGAIPVKGKGYMITYLLLGKKHQGVSPSSVPPTLSETR